MKKIFVYKDNMIDLSKVVAIEFDEYEVIFFMGPEWEYALDIEEQDIRKVKKELLEMFKS